MPLSALRVGGVSGGGGDSTGASRLSGTGTAVSSFRYSYGAASGHEGWARGGARFGVGTGPLRGSMDRDFLRWLAHIETPIDPNNSPGARSDYAKRLTSQTRALQSP